VEPVTYANLHRRVEGVARALVGPGVASGDRVLLCAPNSADWIAAYFGIVTAGGIAVPVDDQASRDMLAGVLRHAEPRFAFTTTKHLSALEGASPELPQHVLLHEEPKAD